MTGVNASIAFVHDRREVRLEVSGAPISCTPAGRNPIEPYAVRLSYNISTGDVEAIEVVGRPTPDSARSWRTNRPYVRRRVQESDAPFWLAQLIKEYRP